MDDTHKQTPPPQLVSSKEAAALYGVTHDHIARLCRQQKIRGVLQAGIWYVDPHSVHAFFGERGIQPRSQQQSAAQHVFVYAAPVSSPDFRPAHDEPLSETRILEQFPAVKKETRHRLFAPRTVLVSLLFVALAIGAYGTFDTAAQRATHVASVAEGISLPMQFIKSLLSSWTKSAPPTPKINNQQLVFRR
jgi:hypothetical protein